MTKSKRKSKKDNQLDRIEQSLKETTKNLADLEYKYRNLENFLKENFSLAEKLALEEGLKKAGILKDKNFQCEVANFIKELNSGNKS